MKLLILLKIFILISSLNGKKPSKFTGGSITNIELYPSQVSIRWQDGHICGGTIITTTHILTAASCVILSNEVYSGNLEILSGTNDQFDGFIIDNLIDVAYVICHPEYDMKFNWNNDICILKLSKEMAFDNIRKSIDWGTMYIRSANFFMASWGNSHDIANNQHKRFLNSIRAKTENRFDCYNYFKNLNFELSISQSCATLIDAVDPIIENGDGGVGLIHKKRKHIHKIEGIVSLNLLFKKNTFIYTKIWKFSEWIQSVIEKY